MLSLPCVRYACGWGVDIEDISQYSISLTMSLENKTAVW